MSTATGTAITVGRWMPNLSEARSTAPPSPTGMMVELDVASFGIRLSTEVSGRGWPAGKMVTKPAAGAPAAVTVRGYYPYVTECPSGWQKVLPQPPGQP